MKNPYTLWQHPVKHLAWRNRAKVYEQYKDGRIELMDWERDLFIPQLTGRIKYVETVLEKVLKICEDEGTAKNIGAALLEVVRPPVQEWSIVTLLVPRSWRRSRIK